jgi:hypothetical protein
MWRDFTFPHEKRHRGKKNKFVPLDLGSIPTSTPSQPKAWGGSTPSTITSSTNAPQVTPKYIGPPLTHGPIPGTKLHLQNWIEEQVGKAASWCDAINGGTYKENQGPGYKHVVTPVVYQGVCVWWEQKGSVRGPNAKDYTCGWTEPSDKSGRTLLVGARTQGNIIAYTVGTQMVTGGTASHQGLTRLNLHVDIAGD